MAWSLSVLALGLALVAWRAGFRTRGAGHRSIGRTPRARSGRYQPLRLRLYRMDREMQRREMGALAASPDYVVGSVHALTGGGSLLIASASGSQLGRSCRARGM
jgi:hypothetical protein